MRGGDGIHRGKHPFSSSSSSSSSSSCLRSSFFAFLLLGSFLVFFSLLALHQANLPPFPLTPPCFLPSSSSTVSLSLSSLSSPSPSLPISAVAKHVDAKIQPWHGDLLRRSECWNSLHFSALPPLAPRLRLALFVKKWPSAGIPGGLERHALTLHRALANRGHSVHVFTVAMSGSPAGSTLDEGGLHVHFSQPSLHGLFDATLGWNQFLSLNATEPFDLIHSESVALPFTRARNLPVASVAASWHGISYEVILSDIVADLARKPDEPRSAESIKTMSERVYRVSDEVRFFPSYGHHIATSDYVGDVLRTVYQIPEGRVHVILNGVDETKFHPDPVLGMAFRAKYGVPKEARLVLGVSGRLVKDKGHPILFEAISEFLKDHRDVYLMVAGDGPWGERYKELAPNVKVLGPLPPSELGGFYNALDVFLNPTLRAQGLDHTLLEAMLCAKPLLATHFPSIIGSVLTSPELGSTFHPNVPSLIQALHSIINQPKSTLEEKGKACFQRASMLNTANQMAASYERLFLCMSHPEYCKYPMDSEDLRF